MSNDRLPTSLLEATLMCFATGNVDQVPEIVSEDYYDHQSAEHPRPHGPRPFRMVGAGARKALPEPSLEIESLETIRDDLAESRTHWHWTDRVGDRRVRTTVDRVRVEHGQVVEHWGYEVSA